MLFSYILRNKKVWDTWLLFVYTVSRILTDSDICITFYILLVVVVGSREQGGSPFRVVSKTELRDRQNQKVQLLGISGEILDTIATARDTNADDQDAASSTWPDPKTIVAWVSCTDEPRWAEECMHKFRTPRNVPLVDRVDVQCIYKANKQTHFRDLQQQYPQIEFCDMLFFDNERSNIHEVQKLGVHSVYCPKVRVCVCVCVCVCNF